MTTPGVRVGDSDRQAVVERLAEHFADGRLTMSEYDDRVAKAYGAVYRDDFRPLFVDLPESGRGFGSGFGGIGGLGGLGGPDSASALYSRMPFGGKGSNSDSGFSGIGRQFRGGIGKRFPGRPHPLLIVLGVIAAFMVVGVLVRLFWPLLVLAAVIFFVSRNRREHRQGRSRPNSRDWAGR